MIMMKFFSSKESEVHFTTPVVVRGYKDSGTTFEEGTYTLTVSATGSLIELTTPVRNEQLLLLRNVKTEEEIVCHVESRGYSAGGRAKVRVGFPDPAPRFWGHAFLPEGSDPAGQARPMQATP
jgi:hypothetical protein